MSTSNKVSQYSTSFYPKTSHYERKVHHQIDPKLWDPGQWNDKNVTYKDIQKVSSFSKDEYQLENLA